MTKITLNTKNYLITLNIYILYSFYVCLNICNTKNIILKCVEVKLFLRLVVFVIQKIQVFLKL